MPPRHTIETSGLAPVTGEIHSTTASLFFVSTHVVHFALLSELLYSLLIEGISSLVEDESATPTIIGDSLTATTPSQSSILKSPSWSHLICAR